MSDPRLEIHTQFTTGQSRYVYFLLAAAAAGMGLAVNLTRSAVLSFSQLPLGAAVLCWAFSFYAGCKNRGYTIGLMSANYDLLTQRKTLAEMRHILREDSDQSAKWGSRQFRYLIFGAVCFVAWHILGMCERTIHPERIEPPGGHASALGKSWTAWR